jgi:hypothetical protein
MKRRRGLKPKRRKTNMKNGHITRLRLLCCTISIAIASGITTAAAAGLPTEKLDALQCASSASESCCERWVNVVLTAAQAETDAASMLTVLPRRVDRWVKIEKRPYCAIKKDIEARARIAG